MKLFTSKELKVRENSSLAILKEQEMRVARALADKIKLNNEFEVTHAKVMDEKQKELAAIEFKIKNSHVTEQRNVEALEERKRQALLPIVDELKKLEASKEFIEREKNTVFDELRKSDEARQKIRQEQYELNRLMAEFTRIQEETKVFIERQRKDAGNLIDSSRVSQSALEQERIRHAASLKELEGKVIQNQRAEMLARAAITTADQRIAQEKREQEKTDEKRKMLAVAIKMLKEKGLWSKAQKLTKVV